jgi:hypothetical protein
VLERLLPRLRVVRGPTARGEHVAWCPFHPDGQGKPPHEPNLYVSTRGFICHACGQKGGLRKLARHFGISLPSTSGEAEATYDYRDEQGNLLFQVVRFPGKRFAQRRRDGNGEWIWNLRGVRRVLYRLPDLIVKPDTAVFLVEGEKDADRLAMAGLTTTTNPGGAGKWRTDFAAMLRGRDVIILPDNDEPGQKHAEQVARSLHRVATSVKIVALPDLPDKGDVSDWLDAGHAVDELLKLVEETPLWTPSADKDGSGDSASGVAKKPSQADRLVEIALQPDVELFHDETGQVFARVVVGGHYEIWPTRGKALKRWLCHRFWCEERKAPNAEAVNAALNVVEAHGQFESEERRLHNRTAQYNGAVFYDLGDARWRAVRVTADGWTLVDDPPPLFRRYGHQCAQVEPVNGGDLHKLLEFVNLRTSEQRLLLLVYVVACLVPDIPHPVLTVHGTQGAAKTTLFRLVRRLIDPSAVEVLTFPRDITELVQQLSHHWTAFYDNISELPGWTSDALARSVTGEGFSKRELFTDDEDIIYRFRRCIGLNGINVAARKPDLMDRCLIFRLEPIEPDQRKPEQELWERFEHRRPLLVGALFDVLVRAMAIEPGIRLAAHPRMADFGRWGCAIATALGHSPDEFLAAYGENTAAGNDEVLHDHPIAAAVLAFMQARDEWSGLPSELFGQLEAVAQAERIDVRCRRWPKAANALTRRLNEVAPSLAAVGVDVRVERASSGDRRVVIRATRKGAGNTVETAATVECSATCSAVADCAKGPFDGLVSKPTVPSRRPPERNSFDVNEVSANPGGPDGSDGVLHLFSDCPRTAGIDAFDQPDEEGAMDEH